MGRTERAPGRPGRRSRFARGSGATRLGAALVLAVLAALVLGPLALAPDAGAIDLGLAWQAPSPAHPCGRDGLGRDVLARLLAGGATSLALAGLALIVAGGLGVAAGALAAWCDGVVGALAMRLADLMLGCPELCLALATALLVGPGPAAVAIALGLAWWPGLARLTRSLVLSQLREAHLRAAHALGASPGRLLCRHLLPHIAGPLAVRAALSVGPLIVGEATLSFLGLGVQEPAVSWGTLIRDGLIGLHDGPHLILATTTAAFVLALGFTLLADGLRDALDPRCG